jgi:hypothetical protein
MGSNATLESKSPFTKWAVMTLKGLVIGSVQISVVNEILPAAFYEESMA